MIGISALLVFMAFSLAGYGVAVWARQRDEARQLQARRLASMTGTSAASLDSPLLRDQRLSSIMMLNTLLGRASLVRPLVRLLRQARVERRAGEILMYIP